MKPKEAGKRGGGEHNSALPRHLLGAMVEKALTRKGKVADRLPCVGECCGKSRRGLCGFQPMLPIASRRSARSELAMRRDDVPVAIGLLARFGLLLDARRTR